MNEEKHERFVRVAERRMELLISGFASLGKCASKVSYDYTEAEVAQIIKELERQIKLLRQKFAGKKVFELRNELESQ